MNTKKITALLLTALALMGSCKNNTKTYAPQAETIDTSIVLSVGKVNITAYEFEKNLKAFKSGFTHTNEHAPQSADVQSWKNDFINRAYFLADAYAKGYDRDKHIDSMVENFGRQFLSQPKMPGQNTGTNSIRDDLANMQKLATKQHAQIRAIAHLRFNISVLLALSNKLNNNIYGPQHSFIKDRFTQLLPQRLLTYITPKGWRKEVTVNDFFDYYNSLMIKYDIYNERDISHNLLNMVYADYAYNNAIKNGLTKQPKYLLDLNNYKNMLIYNKYEDEVLVGKQPIMDDEITRMYNLMKPNFIGATNAVVSIFYFDNPHSAFACSGILKVNPKILDTLKIKGLIKASLHVAINYKGNKLSDTLKKVIFNLSVNVITRPINIENVFIVIKKEASSGNRTKNLTEVKNEIVNVIKNEHIKKNELIKLSQLKSTYKLENLTNNKIKDQL